MTRLRVLSGAHAGASIDWLDTRLKIGRSEDLDVYVGDWDVQQIELRRDAEGRHQAWWRPDDDAAGIAGEQRDGDLCFCWLEPLVPVRFGAVILCIGPSDQPWPSDAILLERCFSPEPPPVEPPPLVRRRGRRWSLVMTLAAAPLAVMATLAASDLPRKGQLAAAAKAWGASAAALPASASLAGSDPVAWLRRSLDPRLLADLDLERSGDHVVVRGVLSSRAAVDELNDRLDALPPALRITRRFVATPDIIDRLVESLPDRDLRVTHEGRYRFQVSGTVADLAHATRAVEQVASDLAEFGLRVDASLQPRTAGIPAMSGLLVDSDGTSVLRTPDGVKHILVARRPSPASGPVTDLSRRPLAVALPAQENAHVH